MATIVKHEWHQTDRQYCLELGEDILSEIYPDLNKRELKKLVKEVEAGEADIDQIINDAWENDVELEWDFQYDDCWTDRKGGYEVTYEYGDEDSYHHEPPSPEPTHKCTKCKWVGQSYDAEWQWPEDEDSDEEAKKVCPMCDSDTELTEVGLKEEQERQERYAKYAEEVDEEDIVDDGDGLSEEELEAALEELKAEFDQLLEAEEKPKKSKKSKK